MTLGDFCDIKVNFPEADFWIISKGDKDTFGKPTETFNPDYIGVKVTRTDMIFPKFLYYIFLNYFTQGVLRNLGNGTRIKISDIKKLPIQST